MKAGTLAPFWCIFLTVVEAVDYQQQATNPTTTERKSFSNSPGTNGPLMVFLLDGFRWDYLQKVKNETKGFSRFLKEGSRAEYVEPVFPVVSYVNWHTLSTGLYPESHGIIGNHMVNISSDPTGNHIFTSDDEETTKKPAWWQKVEPIWITATRQQKRSFLRNWSRCDVPFHGLSPDECTGYTPDPEAEGGIQTLNETLSVGLEKLINGSDLVMIYGEEPDFTGHLFGIQYYEIFEALLELDSVFEEFLQKLDNYPKLKEKLNIIVVSDHGMTNATPWTGVTYRKLDDYVDERDILRITDHGTFMNIQPIENQVDHVYRRLQVIPGVDVYMKKDIPEELHYKNSDLTLDILLVARPGTVVIGLQSAKQIPRPSPNVKFFMGVHGYTPALPDMRAIFFARGPAFKVNYVHSPIQMVDIYQLYAYCLGIAPQPHNGTWTNVVGMLVQAVDGLP